MWHQVATNLWWLHYLPLQNVPWWTPIQVLMLLIIHNLMRSRYTILLALLQVLFRFKISEIPPIYITAWYTRPVRQIKETILYCRSLLICWISGHWKFWESIVGAMTKWLSREIEPTTSQKPSCLLLLRWPEACLPGSWKTW